MSNSRCGLREGRRLARRCSCDIVWGFEMTDTKLTSSEFRRALGRFATGVTVVTVERGPGAVQGMTANSFTSVSLDPLLILVCVEQKASILPLLHEKRRFGISVLAAGQAALSEYFAQSEQGAEGEQRLEIRYRWTGNGIPLLEGTLGQFACHTLAAHVSGDHTIIVGEVESAELQEGEPLLFFGGRYRRIAPDR